MHLECRLFIYIVYSTYIHTVRTFSHCALCDVQCTLYNIQSTMKLCNITMGDLLEGLKRVRREEEEEEREKEKCIYSHHQSHVIG